MLYVLLAVAAVGIGVLLGVLLSRAAPVTPAPPDPVVVQAYAARREALKKETPSAQPLSPAEVAVALRSMAR